MTTPAMRPISDLEAAFLTLWTQLGYPPQVWRREWEFTLTRDFRFDFAAVDAGVAVECDGGTFSSGRHTRGSGYERDCEKACYAAAEGYLVFHVTRRMLDTDPARWLGMIADALGLKAVAA